MDENEISLNINDSITYCIVSFNKTYDLMMT
jgi:hypothetical protein